jgi:sulfite exporter TauE/SafE
VNGLLAELSAGLAVCRVAVADNGGLLASLFVTGLIGSLTHCAGMCGPFVLSQVAARLETVPLDRMSELHRLTGAALLPYHLGRSTTYAALGAAAAAAAGLTGGAFRLVAALLLGLAALFLVGMAVPRLKRLLSGDASGEGWWTRSVGRWARPLFASPTGLRGYALGLMLGFIPCGLLYAALAAAAASGDAVAGAFGMLAFAAGTVPLLFAIGVAGHFAVGRWRAPMLKWAPLLLVVNAAMLGVMAWQMVV